MQHVNLTSLCERTGLTPDEVKRYAEHGVIRSTKKGTNQFYSLREVYWIKGMLYFIRTEGLSPEEAAVRIDKEAERRAVSNTTLRVERI